MKRYDRKFNKLARRLENELGGPQDIEWAMAAEKLYLLQSPAYHDSDGYNPATGECNDSQTIDEVLDVLSGNRSAINYITIRLETYDRYGDLPPYPSMIRGRFDPGQWAQDPNRRSDIFDVHAPINGPTLNNGQDRLVIGAAGAAGKVEGVVRRLDRPDNGGQLRPGEILVTVQTDITWTLLFPWTTAIVTDVGAPLSQAAVVARELGIPAVVGCGDATMCLKTGD